MERKRRGANNKEKTKSLFIVVFLIAVVVTAFIIFKAQNGIGDNELAKLEYDGEIAVEINNNIPEFSKSEIKKSAKGVFEKYSKLDEFGRCGAAIATITKELMPTEYDNRSSLGSIYPSGWQSINFWSRCHLIGYQLAAENDNERNLITGTARMNLSGMLPLENEIASYINENPKNHVLYKVEPVYDGKDLVASGVHMQALSLEDRGKGVSFNVYVFNYQPGYIINYKNGTVSDDPDHQTEVHLADKEARYTGEPVQCTEASVKGSSGNIKYIYFTDKDTNNKTSIMDGAESPGSAPTEKGTYYVLAVAAGDNWFPSAASNTAKLVIK